jgi:hypothetical protein
MNVPEIIGVMLLVVIVVIVLSLILFKGGSWGLDTIPKMIEQWFGTTSPEEKTLVKAVACAYYRCIEGCGSGKVKQTNWEDENGEKVSCLDNYCKDEWRDAEGKICGDVAKENPVKVYLDAPVTVTEETWKIFFKDNIIYKPFVTQTECEPYGLHGGFATQALVLPAELKGCETKLKDIGVSGITSCELPDGYYDIWSGKGAGWDAEDIIICSSK